MSLYESGDSSGMVSLGDLCADRMESVMTGEVRLTDLIGYILRGGWPASLGLSIKEASLLPRQYLDAIVDDDVYRIDGVKRDTTKIRLLLRSLARNESTTATNRSLKNDVKEKDDEDIDVDTIASYLDIFSRLFLIENQQPFSSKIRSSTLR